MEAGGSASGRLIGSALTLAICVGAGVGAGDVVAAPPVCEPAGVDGCIPTPEECATGEFNGHWEGPPGGRAVCVGGGGHIVSYVGGLADPVPSCGVVIEDDRTVYGSRARDPNLCFAPEQPSYDGGHGRLFRPAVRSPGGVVAAQSPAAASAAIAVLDAGGNAVDAAVTAAFAVGVARPELSGIGGGGFMVYRGADGETAALDFAEVAPMAVGPHTFDEPGMYDSGTGHMMVGVPGLVAGAVKALRRYGTISLARAIRPAERLARRGIFVSPELSDKYIAQETAIPYEHTTRLRFFDESARVFLDESGLPPRPGSRLILEDYADSLRLVAERGRRAFYRGRIARLIVEEMERSQSSPYPGDQGLLTMKDFRSYKAIWREPVTGRYRRHTIIGMPPPSSGGIFTIEWLNIMEGFALKSFEHSSASHIHLGAEAQKIAFADRNAWVGDPAFFKIPTAQLTSQRYADRRRREINHRRAGDYKPGVFKAFGSPSARDATKAGHTTHVSVIDADGNAVAMTLSIGLTFGSAVVAPGTGFPLNSELNTSQTGRDRPDGGKRQRSSKSPTIVVRGGRPVLVSGGAGFTYIPPGNAQVVSNFIDFGMGIGGAIDAARYRAVTCCTLEVEQTRVRDSALTQLRSWGHEIVPMGEYSGGPIMQLTAGYDGSNWAASDPRNEWGALGQRP